MAKRSLFCLPFPSPGLSSVGAGEWAAATHGGRGPRGWRKLPVGVDRSGVIVAEAWPEATSDDATTGIDRIDRVDGDRVRVTGDVADDTVAFSDVACRGDARRDRRGPTEQDGTRVSEVAPVSRRLTA